MISYLKGNIELDEAYFGGRKKGGRGRGSDNKKRLYLEYLSEVEK